MRLTLLALTLLALALAIITGCAPAPRYVVCTVDDTISFTADNVSGIRVHAGTLTVMHRKGPTIYRNMLPGETCERAHIIHWDN